MPFQAQQSKRPRPVEPRVFVEERLHLLFEMGQIARLARGAKGLVAKFSAPLAKRENTLLFGGNMIAVGLDPFCRSPC
ncbi:MAG: hypothetical protein ACKOJB_09885, partial [Chthoniobacterales bacterium]